MVAKKLLKAFLILTVAVMLALAGIAGYFLANGRRIFISEIEKNSGLRVRAASLRMVFPSTIIVEDFALGESIKAAKITASPSLLGLIKGDAIFNEIVVERPYLKITRQKDGTFDFGIPVGGREKEAAPAKPAARKKEVTARTGHFYFEKLKIVDGNIRFVDMGTAAQAPFEMNFARLDIDVFRPSFLQLLRLQFKGTGDLESADGRNTGRLAASGWIEPSGRNGDALLSLSDVRLAFFEPYYNKFIKKKMKSGDMIFTGDFKSKKNDLKADCHVELSNIVFEETPSAEAAASAAGRDSADLAFLALDAILFSEGRAVFDFSIRTKMDKPRLENVKIRGTFLKSKIEAALTKSPQETVEDFKKIGEEFKAIGKEFKKIFKSD